MRKENFRDFILNKIDSWVLELLDFVRLMDKSPRLRIFTDQLMRSGTSVGANAHEAQGCNSSKQFAHFLEISMRSGHESAYWLYLIGKTEKKLALKAHRLRSGCIEIEKILQKSLNTIRKVAD